MGLALIGDIHGNFGRLAKIVAELPPDTVPIQVGDFGFWPYTRNQYVVPDKFVHFIDGNHDHIPRLMNGECDWPNAGYIRRGEVWTFDNRRILFLGGASSVDRKWRPHNFGPHAWFDEELISDAEVELALANAKGGVDLMITHTPPDWMIRKHFSPGGLLHFEINPATWRDYAAEAVERVWRELGEPPLYCGHMHRRVVNGSCRILDIEEVVLV